MMLRRWRIPIIHLPIALLALPVSCGHPFKPQQGHPFWDGVPLVIAHKGGLGPYPENTIPAFLHGLGQGAVGIEMDVQLFGSGEIVVFHDYKVDDLTDGTGKVARLTLAQLQSLNFDYRSDFLEMAVVPTLETVLDSLPSTALLNIELKGESVGSDGLEEAVIRVVRERGLEERTILTSFNAFRIKRIENDHPGLLTGLITGPEVYWYARSPRFIDWCRADAVVPFSGWTDRDYLDDRPDHRMVAWFEDDDFDDPEAEYRRLISMGIDGFVTDHPALVTSLLPY